MKGCPGASISYCKTFRLGRGEQKRGNEETYNLSAVYSNYEVVPGLEGYVVVLVSQDLETGRGLFVSRRGVRRAF